MEDKKLIVFNLSERGTAEYSDAMIGKLDQIVKMLYCSKYFKKQFSIKKEEVVLTSTNKFLFGALTIFYLPLFLIYLLFKYSKHDRVLFYFPGHHPWYIFIIKIAQVRKIQTIVTVHDGTLHLGEENIMMQFALNSIYKSATFHVYLTDFVRQKMIKRGFEKRNIIVPHPNGLVNNIDHLLEYSHPLKILFLGRINKYKGLNLVLEAFDHLSKETDIQLTIAGEWQMAKPKLIDDRISIIDNWISEEVIRNLIQSHHFLILPYIEASQSGIFTIGVDSRIPMIITSVGGLVEQSKDRPHISINTNSVSVKETIIELYKDPNIYIGLKQKLNKTITPDKKPILEIFNELIA